MTPVPDAPSGNTSSAGKTPSASNDMMIKMARRPRFQHGIKRGRICDWPEGAATPEDVASRVTYTGSAIHKTYPSPAGPSALRADEAKCDFYPPEVWPQLLDALRQAIRARCVGSFRGEFPSRAWIWVNGVLHEARLGGNGDYHGFPINDPRQYPEPARRVEEAPRVEIPHDRV